jgi:hypothetical protein
MDGVLAAQAEVTRLIQSQNDQAGGAGASGAPGMGSGAPEASVTLVVPNDR